MRNGKTAWKTKKGRRATHLRGEEEGEKYKEKQKSPDSKKTDAQARGAMQENEQDRKGVNKE